MLKDFAARRPNGVLKPFRRSSGYFSCQQKYARNMSNHGANTYIVVCRIAVSKKRFSRQVVSNAVGKCRARRRIFPVQMAYAH